MFNHKWFNLYFEKPEITGISGNVDTPDNSDKDDYDILNDDTPEDDKEKDDKVKGPDDKEVDEEDLELLDKEDEDEDEIKLDDDDEDKDKDDDKEDEDDVVGTRQRPSLKDMIKEVPEAEKLFKKFPQLRDAYYREAKFSNLFDTVEDAETAAQKAESLDVLDAAVMSGSSKEVLESIKSTNSKAFEKFVGSFLPTLAELDENLFSEVATPIVNTVIKNLYKAGAKEKDNNKMGAAKIMAHFLHNTYDLEEIPESKFNRKKAADPELDEERKKIEEEKTKLAREKFEEFDQGLQARTAKHLDKMIEAGLDPTGALSDFTRSAILEKVKDRVGEEIKNDRQFQAKLNKLWKAAQANGFKKESADRIITAYLSRAKPLIPGIRAKFKADALGRKKASTDNKNSRTTNRDTNTGTRNREERGKTISNPKEVNWRKQSDMDILNS